MEVAKDIVAPYNEIWKEATNSALLNIDDDIKELYTENFKIGINNIDTINTNTTKICGDIKIGKAETINVMLTDKNTKKQYGSYSTIIEDDQWCTKEIENLIPGEYQVKANGLDNLQIDAEDGGRMQAGEINGYFQSIRYTCEVKFNRW